MNKAELIDELTKKLDADRKTATEAVELIVDTIVRAVNKGESVTITYSVTVHANAAGATLRNAAVGTATPPGGGTITPPPSTTENPVLTPLALHEDADLVQRALVWEAREPDVYVNVFFGFPFADVPDVGMTIQAMSNGDPALARRAATNIWSDRRFR